MSAAHGDQIVVSQVVEELARDSLPAEVEVVDLGMHQLRDLTGRLRVFQVTHPELARDFPPLRSLDGAVGNLSLQATSFVGRDAEVTALLAELATTRLLSLIGTGGVGKTRLAIHLAAELADEVPDGAWVCELAAAEDGTTMWQVVAKAVGCAQRPGRSLAESIVDAVASRQMLLVLDNCEHLLDDVAALAAAIVARCPGVRLIATSREPLGVAGERVVRVRSLTAPAADLPVEQVRGAPAVQLFADRARDAGATTTSWSSQQWGLVGEICRRVDGIPLAIELAAARTSAMSPSEIAARLDERFRLLTGTRRGQVERQQTLRATVDWSYQLLSEAERSVFDRLGVMAGSFDASATAALVDEGLDEWRAMDAIAGLVAKSMLVAEEGQHDRTRYTMLETLRAYARERLEASGEADQWRRRHAMHFATVAEAAGLGFRGADDLWWLARTIDELNNLRAAITWGLDRPDDDDRRRAVETIGALVMFAQEHRSSAIDAMALLAVDTGADRLSPKWRPLVLSCAASFTTNRGDVHLMTGTGADASRALARAVELADEAMSLPIDPLLPNQFVPFANRAFLSMIRGDAEGALEAIEVGRRVLLDGGDRVEVYEEVEFRASASIFEAMAGQFDAARADAERAVTLARAARNDRLLLTSLNGLGWALLRDDPAGALRALEEFVDLNQGRRESGVAASAYAIAGGLRAHFGDRVGALSMLHRSTAAARDEGSPAQVAAALDWSLRPLLSVGRADDAAVFLGALSGGALAGPGGYPIVNSGRARAFEGVRAELGVEPADRLAAWGAALTFDEIADEAIDRLARALAAERAAADDAS